MCTLLLLLLLLFSSAQAANILVFNPTVGYSHVKFIGNIADVLARGGHNVTVWAPILDPDVNPIGTTEGSIRTIVQETASDFSSDRVTYTRPWSRPWYQNPLGSRSVNTNDVLYLLECTQRMFEAVLKDANLIRQLKEMKFDLAVTELFAYTPLGIFEVLGVKSTAVASSLGTFPLLHELTGLPRSPSFVPGFITTYSEDMSLIERLDSLLVNCVEYVFQQIDFYRQDWLVRKYFPQVPDLRQLLQKRVGIIFSNTNEFTESPRPRTNMVKYIGGAGVYPPQTLPQDLEDILNLRESAVLFSLGTVVDSCSLSTDRISNILRAFSHFPETTFLWRFPSCYNETIPWRRNSNVVRLDWIPQPDLLAHRRLKVFITHGGMNSMTETVFRGKPVVAIPLFADQFGNAQNAVRRGYGISIHHADLSGSSLEAALRKLLAPNNSFSKAARQAAKILQGKEEAFRRQILHQVDLLLEFGPLQHLPLPSRHFTAIQLYSIDCIIFVLFSISVCVKIRSLLRRPKKTTN